MNKTKKICYLSVLTALYVVLSAFLKINLIGNIQIDLGYIAFAVALCMFGAEGTVVGAFGCALESILFSAYGFSVSWFVANLTIGVCCGLVFMAYNDIMPRIISIVIFAAVGLLVEKTLIECALYSIPLAVKIPKNAVAFAVDTVAMVSGVVLYDRFLSNRIKK